ncbi:MAG: glutamate [NMDA] receptor-associated protein 1-like protein [Monoraphidium minutum]|nr:MAG: glutamate [NMDA] receptor-associated protein 1-like protein [Monoraphidium minutum]
MSSGARARCAAPAPGRMPQAGFRRASIGVGNNVGRVPLQAPDPVISHRCGRAAPPAAKDTMRNDQGYPQGAPQGYPQAPAGYPQAGPAAPAPPGAGWGAPPPQGGGAGKAGPPPMPMMMPMPTPGMMMGGGGPVDPESQQMESDMAFANASMRNAFVRKVFLIVTAQLLLTTAVACAFMFVPEMKLFARRNPSVYYAFWAVSFALTMVISCVEKARRQFPLNVIILGLFTLSWAFLVGMITAFHDTDAVLLAFMVTCAAVAGLTIFAVNTKIDATKWGSLLGVFMIILLVLILASFFFPFRNGANKILYLAISGLAALLFSAYLIYDIQAIMGGRRSAYSPDDYVPAAMSIYMDVTQIFLAILSIIGLARN